MAVTAADVLTLFGQEGTDKVETADINIWIIRWTAYVTSAVPGIASSESEQIILHACAYDGFKTLGRMSEADLEMSMFKSLLKQSISNSSTVRPSTTVDYDIMMDGKILQ